MIVVITNLQSLFEVNIDALIEKNYTVPFKDQ